MKPETDHPKELAEEALQTLIPFAKKIAQRCENAVRETSPDGFHQALLSVTFSIQLMSQSIQTVKDIIQVREGEPILDLESELHSILLRILQARQVRDDEKTKQILQNELGPHLHSWSRVGIPTLLRSRDC